MAKDLLVIGVFAVIAVVVAGYACLKAASDDDDREGRD